MNPFESAKELIRRAVADGVTPSAAFAVGIGGKLYIKEAFGYTSILPKKSPVNETTLYDMASVTKMMATAMTALRMIADGRISIDDPLTRFFGDAVPKDKRRITVGHLMSHTAGYGAYIRLDRELKRPDEALLFLLSMPLEYLPGKGSIYSCLGYILLGKLLEKVGGESLDRLARQEVFAPLKMHDTCFCPLADSSVDRQNIAYTERNPDTGEWLSGTVHDENARFLGGVSGNAGLFSNLNDCTRFALMLANHGTSDDLCFLPRTVFDLALRDHTGNYNMRRGLGFHLAGGIGSFAGDTFPETGFGHTGFTGPQILVDAHSGLYIVLLQNRVHPTRNNSEALSLRRSFNLMVSAEAEKLK